MTRMTQSVVLRWVLNLNKSTKIQQIDYTIISAIKYHVSSQCVYQTMSPPERCDFMSSQQYNNDVI